MNDTELLEMLRRSDPMPTDRDVVSLTSSAARDLLEEIMSLPTDEASVPSGSPSAPAGRNPRHRWSAVAAAALIVAGAGVGAWSLMSNDTENDPPLALSVTPFDPMTAICTPFDPNGLATVEVAFRGTVSAIDQGKVTVTVDRWYRDQGSRPETVTLDAGASPALDGVAFEQGGRYLVSAADGVVTGCGSSGPAEGVLQQAYDDVLGG